MCLGRFIQQLNFIRLLLFWIVNKEKTDLPSLLISVTINLKYFRYATDDFLRYSDCVYESSWYELPSKFQSQLILIIGNSHRPVEFSGYGMLTLSLMTFTKANIFPSSAF